MRTIVVLILGLIVLQGCKPSEIALASPAPAQPRITDVAKDYQKLTSMTKEPVFVNPTLAMLCKGASQAQVEEAARTFGPHAHTAVRIYMNTLAAEAFKNDAGTYPIGSIIVKEKRGLGYDSDRSTDERAETHSGVGGMIKRGKDYDPDHGDWEYFYFEDATKIESGKITSCVQCHAGAAAKDYVFGNWAKQTARDLDLRAPASSGR
jgi:Cytochrome P460